MGAAAILTRSTLDRDPGAGRSDEILASIPGDRSPRAGDLDVRCCSMSTFLLFVLIIVVAAAGGFLGTLLEVAGWIIVGFVVVGALVGFGLWRWVRSFLPDR
jgi:hypothetical protein